MKTTIDIAQPQLARGRTPKTIAAFALICSLSFSAHAQLGSGWTPDNETYIAQNSAGTTTTAISGGYEFTIPVESGLCRAEMRGNNLPTNTTNQWQGLGTLKNFPSGANKICMHQVFGPEPSTPDLILDEATGGSTGVEIMSLEQSDAVEASISVGVQFQLNTIYDPVGNLISIYVNGTLTGTKVPNSGTHYNKYGQYVSSSGAGPSTFDWVNIQSWSGGTAPGGSPTTFTITASAGANGSISPSGGVVVNQGANQSFTITPNSGYNVSSVTVDGSGQGAITSYTFSNVQANHTISATFQQQSVSEGPYGGTAAAIPGTVQAENYDVGGQGVAYNVTSVNGTDNGYRSDGVDLETCSDTGGGVDLGWESPGQWFKYTVNVATAGTYTVSFRVAAPSAVTDAFHISNSAGTNLSGNVNLPATGGYQTWATVTANVTLPAGQQILTLNQDTGGGVWNINYASFATSGGGTVATPTFSPAGGTYSSAQSVTISDSTGGATIYYTTDGSTPTTSSTVYSSAIAVNSGTVTIKALAALSGDTNSSVASATYTISTVATVATPTFSPAGGTYSTAQTVSISDSTGGATIHYTTDGSTPTASSTVYSSPIAVSSGTVTIQAMGVLAGDNNSAVGSATYTISTGGGGCQTATSSWTSVAATSVSGTFTATFDATPHASGITGFVGMTSGAASSKSSAAWLVKFHSTGDIQAANGSSFTAGATINWVSGSTYHFRVVANTTAGTYSVYVTPPGQGEQTLATNYAFQVSATSLDHIGLQDTAASLQVCNFTD
ncbi:MAG TPA: chitobiase/beta-hexosaminidase C-terminal domain-containing protein [Opitutaceae bacterium]|jgi:hypothetical protein|nr:chitobiase/beta-hexosaminidase C-terminal domain-containing protein [Opitutaceae bacterium]